MYNVPSTIFMFRQIFGVDTTIQAPGDGEEMLFGDAEDESLMDLTSADKQFMTNVPREKYRKKE